MSWCPVCGSSHSLAGPCPGPLQATGPERHGWRVTVGTPHGVEAHGVLVAPVGRLWRARILTYPNVVWTIPGGGATLKFVADEAREAERAALAFVQEHCRVRGHRVLSHHLEGVVGRFDPERSPDAAAEVASPPSSQRKVRTLPVRFGPQVPSLHALTANLSEGGVFVSTSQPADPDQNLRLLLDVQGDWLPLRGIVVWSRLRPETGRSLGMGLRLTAAPPEYLRFVREIP